ncbi:basement membrane-specific heparan sulfate proteoglycan core protein isoform X4 [Amblyraja radiata]|uniref:basement membrane-specific heparan sulfate proteoglycan core protein isoform X4 n=1 Tax=Amblyraja radiata TaxID=386614 RepID=UPI001403256C|nr:basement membrane-specific heparan sulfate proteoglycan core protein isoform X4 [Amblyraja radiata]
MGGKEVWPARCRLLAHVLLLSLATVNASKVLDEVLIPVDAELDLSHQSYPEGSDDEDFGWSAEGSTDIEEGSTPGIPGEIPTTPSNKTVSFTPQPVSVSLLRGAVHPAVIPLVAEMNSSPEPAEYVYYRVLVNFTNSIVFNPQLEDFESEAFREISEGIIDSLESEYHRISGDQSVTVVLIREVDHNVLVELDVGSDRNNNDAEIQEVVYSVVRSGSIGPYETTVEGFLFRHLGQAVDPSFRPCHANEFTCSSGECVPLDYRCDLRADCSDMSDEDDCADLFSTVATSPTIQPTEAETTMPAFVIARQETVPQVTPAPVRRPGPGPGPGPAPVTPNVLRPCPVDKAVCQDGQCIPRDYLCDGERDCTDGSDELDCGTQSPCEPNEFKCKNSRCALKLWRCDGDNDCGDESDEEYCPTKGPGDMCAPEQFVCVSNRLCIPASYQCDEEADCPDRSDEFGCTPPQVITPPEETVMVKRGATVVLTCVAAGVPTPIITWRLNWGHIPITSRVTMTSQNGQGTLVIRDVKESDQGAYTCEAINARGMIFAIPDALLILKSNPGLCPGGQFNVEGTLRCIPCFCSGLTNNCVPTSRYRTQIRLRFTEEDNFMGVNVTVPASSQPPLPPLTNSQMIVDPEKGEFKLVDLSRRFLSQESFWTLPKQFLGYKVDSYGGHLRYKVRYSVPRGQVEPEGKLDVIITGNGRKLVYKVKRPAYPNVINQRDIIFTEDKWQHESGTPVTREDLMMTLANLDSILIQTKYDNRMASVGLSDIVMDTTSVEVTNLGRPLVVEECRCPQSYVGLSCETCAPGFNRVPNGQYLGVCDGCSCNGHASTCDKVTGYCLNCQHNTEGPQCDKCKAGFFGKPTGGTPGDCKPCPCPHTSPSRRFSDTCFVGTDNRPICDACRKGYSGRRCETCAAGYTGDPMQPGGKCTPTAGEITTCDSKGTDTTKPSDGYCVCKPNVVGRFCAECSAGSFNLDDSNVDGCLKCFCMGNSKECASSSWHRDQVQAALDEQERGLYKFTNMADTHRITEGIRISASNELIFTNFATIPRDIYYWILPKRFKGDKVTSYGGKMQYTILQKFSHGSSVVTGLPDVILQGNNIFLEHYTRRPERGVPTTITIHFKETEWRRADGQPSTREHLLMALADINLFMIRGSYSEGATESRISQIRMDVAVPHSTGQEKAVEVEECVCPEGYKGTSCQECDLGYTRTTSGLYLGICERCECNGHSDCDVDTGECQKCQHNTQGQKCEQCKLGFYGDAKGGKPDDCQPCPCPGTTPSNQFSETCFLGTDGKPTCNNCPSGFGGRNCERCAPGYTGNPTYGQRCTIAGRCTCDWRGSIETQCDASGNCRCKPHVEGPTCDSCKSGHFFLSTENREGCLPCFCMGVTQQCSSSPHYRQLVASPFVPPNNFQNFSLVSRQRTTHITSGFTVTVREVQPQLSFGRFGQYTQESYYWQLPEVFQGDKREEFFARIRRGHKKDPSLTEEQLRKDAAIWELLSSSSSHSRLKRSSKSVPDMEEQKRIDDEVWAIITGFAAEQLHKPHSPVVSSGKNQSRSSRPFSRLASAGPAGPPAPSASRKSSAHSVSSSSSRTASSHSSLSPSLLSHPAHHKKMKNISKIPSLQAEESANLIASSVWGPRPEKYALLYKGFSLLPENNFYWRLPHQYLGNKVTSYGGRLRYTLSYDSGFRGTAVPDADVQIIGNDITLVTYHAHQLRPRETMSFEVTFKEQLWKRPDGQPATREHLLMVLADLDEVLIRATYSTDMISASLSDVSMEIAVPFYTSLGQAQEVEECHCPQGYHGLSCQDCAPGYTRTSGGLYLGHCERCECNGHSDACHPETGACSNCLHNTAGEFCDHCAPGHYGDATAGSPEDCQPCACPLPIAENQFSPICENNGADGFRCTACLLGYTGQHCEYCAPGYSGNPRIPGQRCLLVDRNPFVVRVIPERAEVEQGGRVVLKCQVIGQAPFYYYWSRADGQPLSNRVQQRAQGEELLIQEVKPSDAGIYICTCRNMESSNSSRVEVIVTATSFKAITVTVEEPKTQTVRAGITVNFICTAKSQSPAYTLVWTRQHGSKLPNTAVDFNGILTIRNVRPEDAGIYVCTGSNMFAMDEGTAVLTVPASSQVHSHTFETPEGYRQSSVPVATIEPQILTVKQGQTAEFRCTATGNPPPTLEWFGGQGNIISPNAVIQDGLLRFVATEHSDEAEYSCKASNSAGHNIATTVLYVQSGGNLPRVQVSPQRIEVPEGDTVRLYCRAAGHPTPTLTWKKRGGELPPQAVSLFGFLPMGTIGSAKNLERRIQELQAKIERTDIGTLVIPSITTAHSGVYLCVGTNAAGSTEGRIEVMVFASQGSVPMVRIQPSPATVRDGETLELYCQATGDPQPVITWRRARGRLTTNHQVQGPVLRIRPATRAEAGSYICHAENSLGMQDVAVSVSITSAVSPRKAAPTVNVYSSPSTVTEGESLELHCQVTGQPQPRVTWHRTGGPLTANHQVQGSVLRILHIMPPDIGDYICRAENNLGRREVKFSVSVTASPSQRSPPIVLVHPSPTSVTEGEMVELHCQVTGHPQPQITWYRTAGPLTTNHQVDGSVLRILQVTSADAGDFMCRAENVLGMQEIKFSVLIISISQSRPPTVLVHPTPTSVTEGEMVELHCQVTGQPQPRITWYRTAGPLTTNHQVDGSVLRILRTSTADVGDYVCRAENVLGMQEIQFTVLITSISQSRPPTVLVHPSPTSVTEGEMVELHCQVTGQPQPRITWYRTAGPLTTNHQVDGSVLRILHVSPADVGDYVCRAQNALGMQEIQFSVLIISISQSRPPTVLVHPSPTSVTEGEMVELQCQVTGQPQPRITWYRTAGPLTTNHQVDGSVLRILRVTSADVGDFICRAENVLGMQEIRFSVLITSISQSRPPTVLVHPSPTSVTEGEMVELQCQVTGQPQPRITWSRTAGPLTTNHQVDGSVLRILRVTSADVGDFICRAENVLGMQEIRFSVLITSISQSRPPTVLVHPTPTSVTEGEMVELQCQVTGQPQPRITWYRTAGPLTTNHQVDGSVLRILRVTSADVGDFICRAENVLGMQEIRFSVLITSISGSRPPTVLVHPSPTSVTEGEMVELQCQVTGQPQPRITWYRTAGPLTTNHQVDGSVLRILHVTTADAGEYVCRAENALGLQEITFSVLITTIVTRPGTPPKVKVYSSPSSITEGEMLELRCLASGQPEPRVTWSKGAGHLTTNHQVDGPVLRILRLGPADAGDYICRAENVLGMQEFKFSVSIASTEQIYEGVPIVRVQPTPTSVTEGDMLELHCQVTGHPQPFFRWYKMDGTLTERHETQGSLLRILEVTPDDMGDYVCRAENTYGMEQLIFSVSVTSMSSRKKLPVITTRSQDVTEIEGSDAVFQCQVTEGARPFHIVWKTPHENQQDNMKISSDGTMITISRIRQQDQGQYKCIARNQFGSAFSIMTLIVQGPPTVSVSPRGPVRLGLGDSITLECIGMGEPRPTISWHRSGGRQSNNVGRELPKEGEPILTISSARLQDSGTYTCRSRNMFGTTEAQVEVIVDRSPSTPQTPQVTAEEPSITTTAGQIATLRCSATGYPTPIIQWSKLRAPLPWQHKIVDGSLVIPNVGLQDSGQYICNASNSAGFNELFIMLDVETTPYATFDVETVSVRVGEIVRLHCLSQGTPPITYEWSKVNGTLPDRAVKRNGILQINLAVVSDSGRYKCLVKNKVGQSDAIATVNVKSPPAVRISPQIEVKNIGGTVEFTCSVIGHPAPRIEWLKEGGHLPPNHKVSKGVLRIQNVQEGNEGVYICRALNQFGQAQDSAKLVIQALPIVMINVRTSMQMVMVGGSVEFECEAIGDPQPFVKWSKVESELAPEVMIKNGMLKFEHVKESDAGRYRCTATNDVGSVQSEVVLYVQTVPMIAPHPELKEVAIGSTAVFPCLASGFPVPEVTWSKLEGELPPGANVENNVLTIPSAAPEHTGTYVCTATNEQGIETAYAMLQVRERKVPYFTQTPISYIAVPTIKDAYHQFKIKITFRPDAADALLLYSGMIIYNGQRKNTGADFISFSLVGGRPEFRFDVGSGMATIRHPNPISLGEYHTVVLYRNLTQGSLYVDTNLPVNGSSQGSFRGLDLNEELYIGGYPNFDNISKVTGSNSGFMGCIRQLIIQGDEVIFSAPDLRAKGISNCPVCKDNPCKNGGQCLDSKTSSYVCRCRSGFTGSNCEHSQALHCHPEACGPDATCVNIPNSRGYNCRCHLGKSGSKCMDGVLITAPSFRGGDSFVTYPPLTNVHNELTIELEFKPRAPTGLMFYSSGKRMKMIDFISVAMLNGHVEFRYELGSGLAVLRSAKTVALNKWHKLRAHRHDRAGSLTVDNEEEIRNVSPGKSLGLNLRSPMYLGGVARSDVLPKAINITEGIDGCIAKVLINGKKVDISYTFSASQNVDQCYDNSPCDRVPCLHGGRCLMTGEYEYQCICTSDYQGEHCETSQDKCLQGNPCMNGGTCEKGQCLCPMGYTGLYCELGIPAPPPEWHMEGSADSPVQYGAFFHSGGYIILPKQMFPRSSPSVPETIEMEVRTTTSDGLLLWQGVKHGESGKGKDYVSLGLQNGHVLFSYQLGSGEANILSDDPINDGEWHKIIAVREGKRGYAQLDGDEIVYGESKGDKVMVNTGGSIYLGGAPEVKYFTGGKFTSGITGCIRKVILVNKRPGQHRVQPVDLRVHAEGGVNAEECQS